MRWQPGALALLLAAACAVQCNTSDVGAHPTAGRSADGPQLVADSSGSSGDSVGGGGDGERQPRLTRALLQGPGGKGAQKAGAGAKGEGSRGDSSKPAAGIAEAAPKSGGGQRCDPAPTKQLFRGRARDNAVMFAVMNQAQWDFGQNWLHHIKAAGIDYYVVAASDVATSQALAAAGEPCFDWIDEEIPALGLEWGQEGWRRMTWSKVFVLDAVVGWGFNLVISDVDVAWLRDPLPLFKENPHADLIFSEDGSHSQNPVGDEGLEQGASPHHNFNTGVYLMRYGANTTAWAHAWRQHYDDGLCSGHDQDCCYQFMRTEDHSLHPQDERLQGAWNNRVWMGMLDPSMSLSAHTMYLQQLHKKQQVQPYVVHMTWSYNGIAGKRSRLRDLGLWVDPPAYYGEGSFVTVDLQLPEGPKDFTNWNENEDMISFHLAAVHSQLQQAYVGLALAVAAGRSFILPKMLCYCEKIWYAVVRCRVVDAQDMPLPIPCPQDYIFDPAHYDDVPDAHGPPLSIREGSFLDNERTPAGVKESVLTIQPSAALDCTDCVQEQPGAGPDGSMLLLVPPALTDAQLLPLLEQYKRYRVWRFSFDGVGGTRRAYGGFAEAEAAVRFDARMEHITTNFCCRRVEELLRYHISDQDASVLLSMTSEFSYSGKAR